MSRTRAKWIVLAVVVAAAWPVGVPAQNATAPMARWWEPANNLPNPWVGQVLPMPDGRKWGSTAGVDVDPTDDTVWIIDRCGSNSCVDSPNLDPILHYDKTGRFLGSFGKGMFAFPHGIHVDSEGNIWVTDPLPADGRGAGGKVGQQVTKLNRKGEVLMKLGTALVTGKGPDTFSSPSDVVVGRNGDIFVADGHAEKTNERIVKFDRNGRFITEWGSPGFGPCGTNQFSSTHALEIDSRGRLFLADRDNNRIQIFDQDGKYLDCWHQFGRPSGIHIDANDTIYVADSESRTDDPEYGGPPSLYKRGIRVGSARDGSVSYFIPDPNPTGGSSAAEGVAATNDGIIFGAEVGPRQVVRYQKSAVAGGTAPSFVPDAGWPKPLPNNWIIGEVGGLTVDSHDNIWVYHRPRSLSSTDSGAQGAAGKNARGEPISPLGHPRPYGQLSGCCVPAPSVLQFDKQGNLLKAWGGPADPGFLEKRCRAADGCYWPGREHGIFVDHNDFVWISGNGEIARGTNSGDYPWAANFGGDDSQILKFTSDGIFVMAIGTQGMRTPNSNDVNGGRNGTPQPYLPADFTVDPRTNTMYIADGYGNRRVLIVDAATGKYVGHFGAYGQNPVVGESTDPAYGGAWAADFRRGELKPKFFRSPLHCAELSRDGFLYVCDRGNNRIQVFRASEVGKPCQNPDGQVGRCGFVGEVHVAPQTAGGTSGSLAFSADPEQSCLYVADLTNFTIYEINRKTLQEVARFGSGGRGLGQFHWPHKLSVDSEGNVYSGEVDGNGNVQKFLRSGAVTCSGTGRTDVGAYRPN